jgi:putative toxin-antitoxin system antitoxin component (TIGR02293 family)
LDFGFGLVQDILPQKLWHNVHMAHAAAVTLASPPFPTDWAAVERGLPLIALDQFAKWSGLSVKDFQDVVIPARTLKHRRQRQESLNLDESDRLARVARLYGLTVRVFGNTEKARRWLSKPKERFQDNSPIAMMRTEVGGRQVEEMLYQIDEGMFA